MYRRPMPRKNYAPKNGFFFHSHLATKATEKILWHYWQGDSATDTEKQIAAWAKKTGHKPVSRKTITRYFHHFGNVIFNTYVKLKFFSSEVFDRDAQERIDIAILGIRSDLYDENTIPFRQARMNLAMKAKQKGMDKQKLERLRRRALRTTEEVRPDIARLLDVSLIDLSSKMRGVSPRYFHAYLARALLLDDAMAHHGCTRVEAQRIWFGITKADLAADRDESYRFTLSRDPGRSL